MTGTLTVFDLDDTLFYCHAKVYVQKADGSRIEIRSSIEYELQPDEEIDYGEFRSSQLFVDTAEPIDRMIRKFKSIRKNKTNPNSRIIILTARADFDDADLFLTKLDEHGIYHKDVHIHRAGNLTEGTTAERKCLVIKDYIQEENFRKVRMFDDSYHNLRALKNMASTYPNVRFEAWHVDHEGCCKRF